MAMTLRTRNQLAFVLTLMTIAIRSDASEYIAAAAHFAAFSSFRNSADAGCAAADSVELKPGGAVKIAMLSRPQRPDHGSIMSRSASPCEELARVRPAGPFYMVGIEGGKVAPGEFGILIGTTVTSMHIKEGVLVAGVDETRYKFDECASREGVHLVVRSLADSRSEIVWHDYVYLGYDVEPTCTGREAAAIDSFHRSLVRNAQKKHAR